MADPTNDGDLLAHMHGEGDETLPDKLAASPGLSQALAQLNQLDALLQEKFGGWGLPNPQDLVDVVSGRATATQRLIVAAYVRDSERGRAEMAALEAELAQGGRRSTPLWREVFQRIPLLLATPVAVDVGLRSSGGDADALAGEQIFQATALQALVTLRVVPPIRERWQIEGYVTRNFMPVAEAELLLHRIDTSQETSQGTSTGETPSFSQSIDDGGFFIFDGLPAGDYILQVQLPDGVIEVPTLTLTE